MTMPQHCQPARFFKLPSSVVLVDWEYARIDDPAAHFARLLTHWVATHSPKVFACAVLSRDKHVLERVDV